MTADEARCPKCGARTYDELFPGKEHLGCACRFKHAGDELLPLERKIEAAIERGEAHYWDTFDANGNVIRPKD